MAIRKKKKLFSKKELLLLSLLGLGTGIGIGAIQYNKMKKKKEETRMKNRQEIREYANREMIRMPGAFPEERRMSKQKSIENLPGAFPEENRVGSSSGKSWKQWFFGGSSRRPHSPRRLKRKPIKKKKTK